MAFLPLELGKSEKSDEASIEVIIENVKRMAEYANAITEIVLT